MPGMMDLFDAHLDLSMNALDHERDQRLAVAVLRERERVGVPDDRGIATVSLDELRAGGCGVVLSTVIARAKPWVTADRPGQHGDIDWPDPSMAYSIARGQLAYYRLLEGRGALRVLEDAGSLKRHLAEWDASPDTTPVGMILTMEGADPIVEPEQLRDWHALGLRTLMLAHFGKSYYAHGTPTSSPDNPHDIDGPLTDMGRALLPIMHELGMTKPSPRRRACLKDASTRATPPAARSPTCRGITPMHSSNRSSSATASSAYRCSTFSCTRPTKKTAPKTW